MKELVLNEDRRKKHGKLLENMNRKDRYIIL